MKKKQNLKKRRTKKKREWNANGKGRDKRKANK